MPLLERATRQKVNQSTIQADQKSGSASQDVGKWALVSALVAALLIGANQSAWALAPRLPLLTMIDEIKGVCLNRERVELGGATP